MRCARCLACLAGFFGAAISSTVAGDGGGQPLELNIQMTRRIPGIWISGASGPVSIEYTANLDPVTSWILLATVSATNSPYFYSDASAANRPKRFYRAVFDHSGTTNTPSGMVWIPPGTFTGGSVMDPRGATSSDSRVYRGGSWANLGVRCRSAFRWGDFPVARNDLVGLRPVLAPVSMAGKPRRHVVKSLNGDLTLPIRGAPMGNPRPVGCRAGLSHLRDRVFRS